METVNGDWAWAAYALFRGDAKTSVKTLELYGFNLTKEDVDALQKTMTADNALGVLWQIITAGNGDSVDLAESEFEPRTVTLPAGIEVTCFGLEYEYLSQMVKLPCDWKGILIGGEASTPSTADILLPGFGLCRVQRDVITRKRQKIDHRMTPRVDVKNTANTPISAFVLGVRPKRHSEKEFMCKAFVPSVLRLIGRSLKALAIHSNDVDDECLGECLTHCPKLRTLRLVGLSLRNLDPLIAAYHQHQMSVSSLELRDI